MMRPMLRLALILIFAASAALAQGPRMNAAEFRAMAEGWTLHFADETGEYFGSEQYFENGQTVWLPAGGRCARGIWADDGDRVCFLYGAGVACWRLYREGEDGMVAVSADEDGAPPLTVRLIRRDRKPVLCPEGPGV